MLAAFKEFVLPYIVYIAVFATCAVAVFRRAYMAIYLLCILVALPQFWYPTHEFPLGTQTLTLLTAAAIFGGRLQRSVNEAKPPNGTFVLLLIFVSYLTVWIVSRKFDLPLPISGANEVLADWKNFAMMLSLYFASYLSLRNEQDIRRITLLTFTIIIVMTWRELAGFVSGDTFSYNRRAVGAFWMLGMNANHFAAFIAHYSVPAIGLYSVDLHAWRRRFYLLTFIASLYPLFYSYSRGAYLAVVAAMIVVGVIRDRRILVIVAILLASWQTILPDSVVDRIQMTESEDGTIEESAAMRLVVWDLAKQLFSDNPILGIGFHGFYFASGGLPLRNVHNYFLQTAAEQGIIGLLLLACLFLKALWSGWNLYRRGSSDFLRGLGLGFIACVSACLVTNIFGDRFSQLEVGCYFWVLLGAVDRARVLSNQHPAPAPAPASAEKESSDIPASALKLERH